MTSWATSPPSCLEEKRVWFNAGRTSGIVVKQVHCSSVALL